MLMQASGKQPTNTENEQCCQGCPFQPVHLGLMFRIGKLTGATQANDQRRRYQAKRAAAHGP